MIRGAVPPGNNALHLCLCCMSCRAALRPCTGFMFLMRSHELFCALFRHGFFSSWHSLDGNAACLCSLQPQSSALAAAAPVCTHCNCTVRARCKIYLRSLQSCLLVFTVTAPVCVLSATVRACCKRTCLRSLQLLFSELTEIPRAHCNSFSPDSLQLLALTAGDAAGQRRARQQLCGQRQRVPGTSTLCCMHHFLIMH